MASDKEKESERLKALVREKYAQIAREAPKPGDAPAVRASSPCCAPAASPCCAPAAEPSVSTYYTEDVAVEPHTAAGKLHGSPRVVGDNHVRAGESGEDDALPDVGIAHQQDIIHPGTSTIIRRASPKPSATSVLPS